MRKPVHKQDGDFLILESSGLDHNGAIDRERLICESKEYLTPPSKALQERDILIRAKGTRHQAILFEEVTCQVPVYPTSYFLILSLDTEQHTCAHFLTWQLNQDFYQKELANLAGGATVKHLTKKRLSTLEVSLPPLEQQQQLLKLDKLTTTANKIREQIQVLHNEFYQASISQYLGGAKCEI